MKQIKLTQNKIALVDDEDFEKVSQFKWYFRSEYACRMGKKDNKRFTIWMHRFINNTPDGFETDHINSNKLDNRGDNLRSVTRSENLMNIGLLKNNTSGYKGVYWRKSLSKWQSAIRVNNKLIHLGFYSTIQKAWLARRLAERLYYAT